MKIALLNDWMKGGGAERSMCYIANGLGDKGNVNLYCLESGLSYELNSNVHHIPFRESFRGKLHKVFALFPDSLKLKKYSLKNKHNVVLSFQLRSNIVNVLAKMLGASHKVVISERVNPELFYKDQWYNLISFFIIRFFYNRADYITCNSSDTKVSLVRMGINVPIRVVTNGYKKENIRNESTKSFKECNIKIFNDEKINILLIGRLCKQKGQLLALEAIANIKNKDRFNFIFIGSGPLEDKIEKFIKDHELESVVSLLGFTDHPYFYIKNADYLLTPSLYEGYPNVICESIILGTPIISFEFLSSAKELVTKSNGYLIPMGNTEKLKELFEKIDKKNQFSMDDSMINTVDFLVDEYCRILHDFCEKR